MICTQIFHCFGRDFLWRVSGVLLAGFLSVTSALGEVDGDWSFSYSDADYTATITQYSGALATPSVPSKVSRQVVNSERDENGRDIYWTNTISYAVTSIQGTFSQNGDITSIAIPASVRSIGHGACCDCTNLVDISFSVPPTTIGTSAFLNCTQLKKGIDLSRCTSIGNDAFRECSVLEFGNLELPCITNIGLRAFMHCPGITNLVLSSSLKNFGSSSFNNCQGLQNVYADGTELTLPVDVFSACSNLQSVVLGNGITSISTATQFEFWLPFAGCSSLRSVEIGTGVDVVSTNIFRGLGALETVIFRGNIQSIESCAFYECKNLVSVSFGGAPKTIENGAFYGCRRLEDIDLSQCTSIGAWAFSYCDRLSTIELPVWLQDLGVGAFSYCTDLTNALINGNDLTLPTSVLTGCSNLLSVTLGDGVTAVSTNTTSARPSYFQGCNRLKSLEVGIGLTSIGPSFCFELPGLESAIFKGNIQDIGRIAFQSCTNLVSISLGGSPKAIDSQAFYCCQRLEGTIDLSQCTSIASHAFAHCDALQFGNLVLESVTNIGPHAFSWGPCLTNVYINGPNLSLSGSCFAYCSDLASVVVGNGVTNIGSFAFQNCTNLSKVWFSGGVPAVGSNPFCGVANGARGHYMAGHAAEWLPQIGADGKWQGLVMAEIPSPELRVEGANPAAGSLTLAWDDSGAGEGVTYSVYRGAGESLSAAVLVTNGLTGASWTDEGHAAAEPIQKPLNYWIVAEGGGYGERESNRVETRRRYALCVGINKYMEVQPPLQGCVNDSFYMEKNLVERGGWPSGNVTRLNDAEATKTAIRAAISNVAVQAVPGDIFVYQHASHGDQLNRVPNGEILHGKDGKEVFLCVYDELNSDNTTAYNDYELAADLENFRAGVRVVVIVDACHSGGLFKESARAMGKDGSVSFDLAERVSAIMDAHRVQRRKRGVNIDGTISSPEIGWATAVEYDELALDNGFYHTDEWLNDSQYGEEYWNRITEEYNCPAGWTQGGVFTAGATWGWWSGAADKDALVGDQDGYCDAYEFWKQGCDCISRVYGRHAQCLNIDVLRSVKLGECEEGTGPVPLRTVRFMGNGGTVTLTAKTVPSGQAIGALPVPWQLGHVFTGWYTAFSGGTQLLETSEITASLTVFARWVLAEEYAAWLEEQGASEATLPVDGDADEDGSTNWAEYVSGTNPQDGTERLEARIRMTEDGRMLVEPSVNVPSGRLVKVLGKQSMMDDDWTVLPENEDWDAEGWRFFRVRVELAE